MDLAQKTKKTPLDTALKLNLKSLRKLLNMHLSYSP